MRVRALVVLVVAVAAAVWCAVPASARTWVFGRPALVDRGTGFSGIACPSASLCVAVDSAGGVLTTSDPSRDAAGWRRVMVDPLGGGFTDVSCASAQLCVATDAKGNVAVSTQPGAGTWQMESIDSASPLAGVSCPSASLCVVAAQNQTILASTDPAGPASGWTPTPVTTGTVISCAKYYGSDCAATLVGVACPSVTVCLALDSVGDVLTNSDAVGGGPWSLADVDSNAAYAGSMTSISCPSTTLCVLSSWEGYGAVSADPSGTPSKWLYGAFGGICPLTALCLGGTMLSTNPTAGFASWRTSGVAQWVSVAGAACQTRVECVAVDSHGYVLLVTPARVPRSTGRRPRVIGRAQVGRRLRATTGGWSGTPTIAYQFQWQRCEPVCVPITNATSSVYRVAAADRFWRLRVVVTASNVAGVGRPAVSAETRPVP